MLTISDQKLKQLITEVEGAMPEILRQTQNELRKAQGDEDSPPPKKEESSTEDAPPAADGDGDADDAGSAPPAPPAAASPSPAPAPGGDEGSAPAGAPGGDPAAQAAEGGQVDPAALEAEFDGMPDDELMMFYQAAKNSLFKRQAAALPDAGAGAGGPPPASPAAPPPGAPPAMKSETDPITKPIPKGAGEGTDHRVTEKGSLSGGEGTDHAVTKGEFKGGSGGQMKRGTMGKSERETQLEAELAELKKSQASTDEMVGKLVTGLEKILVKPQRLAVTSVSAVGKPGDAPAAPLHKAEDFASLSKAEINQRLMRAAERDLSKADRELINLYCVNPQVGLDKVAHLLGEAPTK